MTLYVADVLKRVRAIEEEVNDPEAAHILEDDLYEAVIRSIAERGCDDPLGCAIEALKTKELDFPRWCA